MSLSSAVLFLLLGIFLSLNFKQFPSPSSLRQPKALGQTLLSEVFLRGNLIESDYFGLEFQNMQMNWVSS